MTRPGRTLLITRSTASAVFPAEHQLPGVTAVTPDDAFAMLREFRERRVPVVAVIDAETVNVPGLLTELAIKHRDVPVIVATGDAAARPGQPVRGLWRQARSHELVAAVRHAAQAAAQQARVRTTLDQINIRLRSAESSDDKQRHRLLLSGLYLSNILGQASDGIFVTDRQGVVAIWNRAAERLFDVPVDHILNRRIDAVGGASGAALLAWIEGVSQEVPHGTGELTIGAESRRDLEVSLSLITDHEGTGIAISGIARDVTERNTLYQQLKQQTEQLAASNRHKEEFLAVLSHELRTPLNTVLGWSRMIQDMPHDPEHVRRAAEMITRNATVQWRLVTDLLEYARITAGQFSLHRTIADLSSLTKSIVDGIRPEMTDAGLQIHERYEPGQIVSVDRDRLSQVVLNLLTNARKFTPSGGEIHVSVARSDGAIELRVRDTGRGIAPEFVPHLFDAFRQADPSTTRSEQGLGLGLAITRRIVELHDGQITAYSEGEGTGALFTVRLNPAPGGD